MKTHRQAIQRARLKQKTRAISIKYATEELRKDRKVVITAMLNHPGALVYCLDEELKAELHGLSRPQLQALLETADEDSLPQPPMLHEEDEMDGMPTCLMCFDAGQPCASCAAAAASGGARGAGRAAEEAKQSPVAALLEPPRPVRTAHAIDAATKCDPASDGGSGSGSGGGGAAKKKRKKKKKAPHGPAAGCAGLDDADLSFDEEEDAAAATAAAAAAVVAATPPRVFAPDSPVFLLLEHVQVENPKGPLSPASPACVLMFAFLSQAHI